MKRMMAPTLPAASRHSKIMTSRFIFLHPALQFDELYLERELLPLVLLALHTHAVRVAPAPKGVSRDLARQNGIVDVETRQLLAGSTSLSSKLWDMFPRPPLD